MNEGEPLPSCVGLIFYLLPLLRTYSFVALLHTHIVWYEFHIVLSLSVFCLFHFPTVFICLFQSHSVSPTLSSAGLLFRLSCDTRNTLLLCQCTVLVKGERKGRREFFFHVWLTPIICPVKPMDPLANTAHVRIYYYHCRLEAVLIHSLVL